MPFLVIDIPGDPGPKSTRATIEKDLIGLVSHARRTTPGLIRDEFLGRQSPKGTIAHSGLFNIDHVGGIYSDDVVSNLNEYIETTEPIVD
jgi:hypothetical protein